MKKIESSYSGDKLETRYGDLRHTNGYWDVEEGPSFYFSETPEHIARELRKGSPSQCGLAEFDIPALEKWLDKQLFGANASLASLYPFINSIRRELRIEHSDSISFSEEPFNFDRTPQEYFWDGSRGRSEEIENFAAVLKDGHIVSGCPSNYESGSNYAHSSTEREDGQPFGHWLAEQDVSLDDVTHVVEYSRNLRDWEGCEPHEDESHLIVYEVSNLVDWTKVRRRVEDALRKTANRTDLAAIAAQLKVRLQ